MGRFAGLSGVKTNQGGIYFLQGSYVVDVQGLKFFKARDGVETFVVEALVVSSTNPERGPGSRPSQVIKLSPKYLETAMGNMKQFIGALLGISDPDSYVPEDAEGLEGIEREEAIGQFWDQTTEYLISDEQPAKGTRIHLSCNTIEKRNSPGEFTKHIWGPLVQAPEAIQDAAPF